MTKIRLLTTYLTFMAGTVIEQDDEKCEQLVRLRRAVYVDQPKEIKQEETKEMLPKKRGRPKKYETK